MIPFMELRSCSTPTTAGTEKWNSYTHNTHIVLHIHFFLFPFSVGSSLCMVLNKRKTSLFYTFSSNFESACLYMYNGDKVPLVCF